MDGMTPNARYSAARFEFESALQRHAGEPEMQRVLNKHLCIIAHGLPVRVQEASIEVRGRPGRSEADYLFVEHRADGVRYGVIELKSPRHRVVRQPRKGVHALTASATTAVQQAQVYGDQLRRRLQAELGLDVRTRTDVEMYVVMGRSGGADADLIEGLDRGSTQQLFPPDVRFVTYDALLGRFVERSNLDARRRDGHAVPLSPWVLRVPMSEPPLRDENRLVQGVAQPVIDQLRKCRFSHISIYARESSWASASGFDASGGDDGEPQFVYLLFGEGHVWMLDVGAGLVTRLEHYHASDELAARREFGAGPLLRHIYGEFEGADIVVPHSDGVPST